MTDKANRSTKTITTIGGHEIVLLDYVTGLEVRAIKNVFMKKMDVKQDKEGPSAAFNGEVTFEAEDKSIETVVVSVDGVTENVVDAVLSLPSNDYDEVIRAINETTDPKKK